jgi:hypothetical protein
MSEMDVENMRKDFHASLEFSREAPPLAMTWFSLV